MVLKHSTVVLPSVPRHKKAVKCLKKKIVNSISLGQARVIVLVGIISMLINYKIY